MQYHFIFGSYAPSYLLIKLFIPDSLADIRKLEKVDQGTFFHEYIHFLQNLTGSFGHAHIWNTYDRIRQLISEQQKSGLNTIHIPVTSQGAELQRTFLKAMTAVCGRKSLPEEIDDATANVSAIRVYEDEHFNASTPGTKIRFIRLQVKDAGGHSFEYAFGETAIAETMALLIENKFGVPSQANNFPYRSCRKLGEYMQTELLENDEILFALCDMALVTDYPGYTFYSVLLKMIQQDVKPDSGEQVYEFGIKHIYDAGWKVWENFEANKNGASKVLKELFANSVFEETLGWFLHVVQTGWKARKENPYLLLQLYRQDNPFTSPWEKIMALMGTPQLQNVKNERFFRPPLALLAQGDKIEPMFLLSLQQLHNTLLFGNSRCGLRSCCEKSTNGLQVDDRCDMTPWARSLDKMLCAYGVHWKDYGLSEKEVIEKDKPERTSL